MASPFRTANALILREVRYKEADRILTIFTEEDGILTAKARGALRKTSRTAAATQQLTYSELTLFSNRERLTVNEAVVKEPFDGLRKNFENYALGCYFAEAAEALLPEEQPEKEALRLLLNCLYALSHEMHDPRQIKAAFEMRLMCLLGYAPDLTSCSVCGREDPEEPLLGIETGQICCRACRTSDGVRAVPLGAEGLKAMRYLVSAPLRQLLSFSLEEEDLRRLARAAEEYLLTHAERRFSTLDYWKRVKI